MIALADKDSCLETIQWVAENIPEYDETNPNNIRSLITHFAVNKYCYQKKGKEAYDFIIHKVLDLNGKNPKAAAFMLKTAFEETPKMDDERKGLMLIQLQRVLSTEDLVEGVQEIAENIVGACEGA